MEIQNNLNVLQKDVQTDTEDSIVKFFMILLKNAIGFKI